MIDKLIFNIFLGWYSTGTFLMAISVVDLLPLIIVSAIYTWIINSIYDNLLLYPTYFACLTLSLIYFQSLSQICSIIFSRKSEIPFIISCFSLFYINMLLSDFMIPITDMHFLLKISSYLSVIRPAFEIILIPIYGWDRCLDSEFSRVLKDFDVDSGDFWPNLIHLSILAIVFKIITLICILIKTNSIFKHRNIEPIAKEDDYEMSKLKFIV